MSSKRRISVEDVSQSKRPRFSNSMELSQCPDFHDKSTMDKEAEAGIIEAISLKNFMCHSKMEFSFGPHVNFLIGNNGSGKSAVLTAIMIGLGGKASVTNRGSSLKDFIMTGKRTSEIVIKLRNRGPDAYKPDVYGDYIFVERKLSHDGSGGYKLRSSKSNTTISGKDELTSVVDHFCIQVDNPVAILTQEASKTFLHSKKPQDKYKFFLKATQLEQTKLEYVAAEESKRVAFEIIKEKGKSLPEMEKEVLLWKQKFDSCESLDSLKEKISNLKKQLAWALVAERERNLEPAAKELKAETLRTPKFEQKVEESEAKVKELEQEHDRLQEEVKRLHDEAETMKPNHLEAKAEWSNKKNAVKAIQEEHRKVRLEKDSVAGDKKQVERRIKELHQTDYGDLDEKRKARHDRMSALEQKLAEQRSRLKNHENDQSQFNGAVAKIKQELGNIRLEEKALLNEVGRTQTQLKNYESSRTDKFSRYGGWMPEVIKQIDESLHRGLFTKRPYGPLGASISVRDPQWAFAVEVCLSHIVRSFLVDNYQDERELEKIFRQVLPRTVPKPGIFTSKFQPTLYNVLQNRTPYRTVLEVLDVSDPVVANCLIDQRGIESILLFETGTQARSVMQNNPPRGFNQAFTKEGDQLFAYPSFRMYTSEKTKLHFLMPSVEDGIKHYREELNNQQKHLQGVKTKLRNSEDELKQNLVEKEKLDLFIRKLRQSITDIDTAINELKNFEEPQPSDVLTLETEAKEMECRLQELEGNIAKINDRISAAKKDQDGAETHFHEVDQLIRTAAERLDPIKSRFNEIGRELEIGRQHRKHYVAKKKEHEKRIQQLEKALDAQKADVEADRRKALEICDEIRTRRTAENIQNEIEQIKKRVISEEKIRGDRNEITKTYHEKQQTFEKVRRELNQISNFLRKLDESLEIRNKWFLVQKHSIALRTRLYFLNYLNARNYSGKLNISHKNETIEPVVYPKATDGGEMAGTSSKSLSGGERSFSTACFVLALWDSTSSPFRCLDEYDVFMDMVNRRITMDMMMKFATKKRGSQFIFLSPLDISGVLSDHQQEIDVKIFELQPPERGKTDNTVEDDD